MNRGVDHTRHTTGNTEDTRHTTGHTGDLEEMRNISQIKNIAVNSKYYQFVAVISPALGIIIGRNYRLSGASARVARASSRAGRRS